MPEESLDRRCCGTQSMHSPVSHNRKETPAIKFKQGTLSWKEGRGSSRAWQEDIEKW